MTTLWNRLDKNWRDIIGAEFDQRCMARLEELLQRETAAGRNVYPKDTEIFNALNLTAFNDVKVVILGQDPYHGEGQAHGLCFSVPKEIKKPPSLKNIYKEIDAQYDPIKMPQHGDLSGWAKQGVLLLNTTLTVREGEAGAHQGHGWERFTDAIISAVNKKRQPVVFLLWGRPAQQKGALIERKHKVLEASHPSPLSAHRALRDGEIHSFLGCGHFKKANNYLEEHGLKPIDWQKI